ncbi:MAG: flagellar biosynthetic protein FliO [Candidatus Thiodiazotropha weberae]|nr:flagellar biosynthetic protein FliO [Candidatus Thiodiazotropha lotti]MCG7986258.1 flagellar biosynthetic protein FliO [Candidatus Thiodiazotropha lotti]MCG8010795.1 flagellar biosynthetic protein FliO [Candidatus Thiodiazotropha lotti]MCG8020543.1 flagellar biosynthetic protein FliO [Candidatus Thiodiazotropha lotti]MCW4207707.1 flagellar biosynthetic protein FliO [Candidatus Thiodiazotropha lotti]
MENYAQELLFTLMALILVVALAWLFLKALKGFHVKQSGSNRINLLLTLPVGSRERVVVVAYRQHEYLVGITAGGMTLLDKMLIDEQNGSVNRDSPEG